MFFTVVLLSPCSSAAEGTSQDQGKDRSKDAMRPQWESMVVSVSVNTEAKGDFFVNRTAAGDFLVKTADMKAMGFSEFTGKTQEIEGEQYVSLKSVGGLTFVFDENALAIAITASPSLLPKEAFDFMPKRQPNVYYPHDSAVFLNYRLDYFGGNSFSFQGFDVINQLGARVGDILFLTDTSYTKTQTDSTFVRLMSSLTYDRREDLQRFIAGDFVATSGDLGSSVVLGGLSLSKIYAMDPYFIRYPLASFTGFASVPSTMEIYLNGMRVATEKISPGEFALNNFSYYGGANSVDIVIRDAFGRVQKVRYPFYFTDILLRKGLHEYSYNVGMIRNELGTESNDYSGIAWSGFHRYGVSDALTVGVSSEGGNDNYLLGTQASFLMKKAGVLTFSISGSRNDDNRAGFAGIVNYGYQTPRLNAQVFFKGFSKDYTMIDSGLMTDRTKYEAGAGLGYGTEKLGSFSAVFDSIKRYAGQDSQSMAVSYSRNLSRKISLLVSYTRRRDAVTSNDFFIGLTYYPREDLVVSSSYERNAGLNSELIQVQKNPPVGEGFGYRMSVGRSESPSGGITTVDPSFQYNGRYGTYTAEYSRQMGASGTIENYNLSAAGSIAYIGHRIGFSRPIDDSFGLVQVGNIEGVRVYQSNQEIGRTDSSGRIFVPNLGSYYDNQVSISDKDIPMNYSIKEVVRFVSPPLRSGSIIDFQVSKFQAITGMLNIRLDGKILPAEFSEFGMTLDGREMTYPTGRGGEFYFENVKPGRYAATLRYGAKKCTFDIIVPESEEIVVDVGGIICEDVR